MKFIVLIILFISIFAFQACFKLEQYPPEPQVEFIDFIFIDTIDGLGNSILKGTLHFSFIDGDGDIGFDTTSPQQNTIFLEKYKLENGILVPIELLVPLNYYVPEFETDKKNRSLKGEMYVNDLNEIYPLSNDTIMYKFYIIDRTGNHSNIDSTGYITVN